MSLSPEQRDALRELLADELRTAWRVAVERGASPDALSTDVEQRRRDLASAGPGSAPGRDSGAAGPGATGPAATGPAATGPAATGSGAAGHDADGAGGEPVDGSGIGEQR